MGIFDLFSGDILGRTPGRMTTVPEIKLDMLKNDRPGGRDITMFFRDAVTPVEGSIVCCRLSDVRWMAGGLLAVDHSGVYVGGRRIIHRDGDGYLDEVSPEKFLKRCDGWNAAVTVFVACKGKHPIGSSIIAERAREALSNPRHEGYDILLKNCHQFCHYCLTGSIDNGVTDFTFTALEDAMKRRQGMDNWRRWDFD